MCDRLGQNKIVRVGKTSGPVLSRLWTKVHEILGQRRRRFAFFNALAWLSMSRFTVTQQIFANKSWNRRKKQTNVKVFCPHFFLNGRPQLLYGRLLAQPTIHRLSTFGWVPYTDLHVRNMAMKWMQHLRRVGENSLPICSHLWTKVHVVLRPCSRPLVVCNALALLCIASCIPKI